MAMRVLVLLAVMMAGAWGQCGPELPGCRCLSSAAGNEREVTCGEDESTVEATTKPGLELLIQCTYKNSTSQQLEMLAGFRAGPVRSVVIRFCPMPLTPLGELLSKMTSEALNETKTLVIQSHGDLDPEGRHFRGFTGVTKFVMSSNKLQTLPEDMLQDMQALETLDLRDNDIRTLPAGLLRVASKLSALELGDNQISDIPDGFFSNSTSLVLLNLWKNNLSTVQHSIFANLQSLQKLDLSSNGLIDLPHDIFRNLTKLRDLNLSANNFSSLPAQLLNNLKNLTRFRLLDNAASNLKLPDDLFADLPKLEDIILNRSGISELSNDIFRAAEGLKNLTLQGNKLMTLPGRIFRDAKNLTMLELSGNQLGELPDDVFAGLVQLRVLKLANNRLTTISDGLLQPLDMLEELDVSSNQLKRVAAAAFQGVHKHLRVVRLDKNRLSFNESQRDLFGTYSPLHMCTKLQEINLAHNLVTEVAGDWQHTMLELRILDLSHNNLTQLSVEDLHFLSAAKLTVDLRHNQISEMDLTNVELLAKNQEGSGTTSRNVNVLVGHNPLNCSSCAIYELLLYREDRLSAAVHHLVHIDTTEAQCADGRPLEQVSSQNLTCVVPPLSEQCPSPCECSIQPSRHAILLRCCQAPRTLPKLKRLNRTELVAENCRLQLTPVVRNITDFQRLTALRFGGNNLTEFRVRSLPDNAEVVELHDNRLERLSEGVLRHLNTSNLTRVTLAGNPWLCDCEARDLLTFVQAHFTIVTDLANVTCNDGRPLYKLSASDLCPVTAAVAASMAVAAVGLLLGAAFALYYRYQQEIKVWLYAHNLCLWFVTEDELDKDKKYDAFVSYSHKDEAFVAEHLVPGLEPPFKLCIHVRDWVAGDWIPEQIARSVQNSRRTLVVLSNSFIDSVWGRLEFRAAHQQALSEGRVRVIVILLEDVGPMDKLDPELRAYLTTNTYLEWGDPWFWDKLRYALPHRPDMSSSSWGWGRRRVMDAPSVLACRIEDKLEMIRTNVVVTPPSPSDVTPPAATNGHAKPVC